MQLSDLPADAQEAEHVAVSRGGDCYHEPEAEHAWQAGGSRVWKYVPACPTPVDDVYLTTRENAEALDLDPCQDCY